MCFCHSAPCNFRNARPTLSTQLSMEKHTRSKKLLGAPGLTTMSKKLLGAPGLTARSKKLLGATRPSLRTERSDATNGAPHSLFSSRLVASYFSGPEARPGDCLAAKRFVQVAAWWALAFGVLSFFGFFKCLGDLLNVGRLETCATSSDAPKWPLQLGASEISNAKSEVAV